ncbi:reverse transcriptase domain-containing protein [Tanacetum coccineum]
MFLGYQVNTKGIKICPNKADAVLSLQPPKCLKDVQKLNGKLASLNRFLAKSAEKSLPFFKTLKKCTKKSDFLWTEEAEAAFRQIKEHIAKLPMLTAPEEQEELIVYLTASKEAVCVVLMTEREARQMPIYFASRPLRGPKVNYTSMEKLVLALVHASKSLRRYFQAHPIIVITDQLIKNILSSPEVAGRMQKWSIQLGEFGIHYRPRVSVKGQVLANFIVERPEEEDSFLASLGSNSFNSSENSTNNIIPSVFSPFSNNPCLKDVQAFYAKELPISSPDPITPPAILTPSPVLPPSLLFDPRYFFVPEELLPPKKQICSPSSSSTMLSNQTCDLISPSSSVYTPTPPQIFEIGKCSVKMHLKHYEEQIKDILNYLDELYLHHIERMEEERTNGNKLKTELKGIRTQIIRLQKKRLG